MTKHFTTFSKANWSNFLQSKWYEIKRLTKLFTTWILYFSRQNGVKFGIWSKMPILDCWIPTVKKCNLDRSWSYFLANRSGFFSSVSWLKHQIWAGCTKEVEAGPVFMCTAKKSTAVGKKVVSRWVEITLFYSRDPTI